MAIKLDLQANVVICSRLVPSTDGNQAKLSNVYTVNLFKSPDTLPQDVIEKNKVDADEQQAYAEFIKAAKSKAADEQLKSINEALSAAHINNIFSLEQLVELRLAFNELGQHLEVEIFNRNKQLKAGKQNESI